MRNLCTLDVKHFEEFILKLKFTFNVFHFISLDPDPFESVETLKRKKSHIKSPKTGFQSLWELNKTPSIFVKRKLYQILNY